MIQKESKTAIQTFGFLALFIQCAVMVEYFLSICIKLDPFSFSIDIDAIGNFGEPLLHIYLIKKISVWGAHSIC
jgi:hypothetical protein